MIRSLNFSSAGFTLLFTLFFTTTLYAEGPLAGVGVSPTRYASDRFPLVYQVDKGILGMFSNGQATDMATSSFDLWNNLSTATLSFVNSGQLGNDVTSATDPYISGTAQFTDGIIPVVFDSDGSITDDRIGQGASLQVYGFASSVTADGFTYTDGFVIINGRLSAGASADVDTVYREVVTHEIGHMLGIGHSQISMHAEYALMYPTTLVFAAVPKIGPDDAASMSLLYPSTGYTSSVGKISGKITQSNGAALSGVNVLAVHSETGTTYSTVSDYFSGDDPRFANKPSRTGEYLIDGLPPGDYYVKIEPILARFQSGSRVASYLTPINTDICPEWYNGANESGNMLADDANEKVAVTVTAGSITSDINISANDSPTLTDMVEYNGTLGVRFSLPFPVSGTEISRFATKFTAPENGSLLGLKFYVGPQSTMPANGTLTVSVHENIPGSLVGIPGNQLGSVTIPFNHLAADQDNMIWLRHIGSPINFLRDQEFHVVVTTNGQGALDCYFDDANGTQNRTSYYINVNQSWNNLPQGLNGAQGFNIWMTGIYTSAPAGVPVPLIGVNPDNINFGNERVSQTKTENLSVANIGSADLVVSSLSITGASADNFSVESPPSPVTIAPGQNMDFDVSFSPTSSGLKSALVRVINNSSNSPITVPILGTGEEAALTRLVSTLDFGNREVDGSYDLEEAVIRNSGNTSLRINGLEIDGPDGGNAILLAGGGSATLSPGETYSVRLRFRPTEERDYSATLRVLHELGSSPEEYNVVGKGVMSIGAITNVIASKGFTLTLYPVYPNPVRRDLEFVYAVEGAGRLPATLSITDLVGNEIHSEEIVIVGDGSPQEVIGQLDLSEQPSGRYYLMIRSARGSAAQPFVLVR